MKKTEGYEGWTNWETWDVALYIQNDFKLCQIAQKSENYKDFLEKAMIDGRNTTPDGVRWGSRKINRVELDNTIFLKDNYLPF